MKNLILTLLVILFTAPAYAVCSVIGGVCTPSVLTSPTLQDKYIPNNLNNMQKTDAFTPQYINPYNNLLLNSETETAENLNANQGESSYNANCQFGVCIPSSGALGEP